MLEEMEDLCKVPHEVELLGVLRNGIREGLVSPYVRAVNKGRAQGKELNEYLSYSAHA